MNLKTAAVRRSTRLEMKKGAEEERFEEETVENVWNLERTEEEIGKKKKRTKMEFEKRESSERKRKRCSTRGEEDVDVPAKKVTRMKKNGNAKVTKMKEDQKEKWICEWILPVLALQKVFSYLNWKDLGRTMLVCKQWYEVGGHPSLWTQFPLQLSGQRLKSFAKICRLAWVKSVSVNLPEVGSPLGTGVTRIQAVLSSLPRLEELFVFCNSKKKTRYGEMSAIITFLWENQLRDLIFKLLLTAYWGRGQYQWRCQHGRDIGNTPSTCLIWIFSAV